MPPVGNVLKVLVVALYKGQLFYQIALSVALVMLGLFIGLFLAIILVVLAYMSTVIELPIKIVASAFHPLPAIALLPLVVLWFGIGLSATLFISIHAVIWSCFLILSSGFSQTNREIIEGALMEGASKWQLIRFILLPLNTNAIKDGLYIGWSRAWRAVISAEMLFGAVSESGGIGWYLYERRAFMDSSGMFAGVFAVMLIGILIEGLANATLSHK